MNLYHPVLHPEGILDRVVLCDCRGPRLRQTVYGSVRRGMMIHDDIHDGIR